MAIVPGKFFFTKGTGVHAKEMRTFEEAYAMQVCIPAILSKCQV
jgi:pyruvoyl-dependent arginine decarboxylase (PvlArgDC)